MKQDNGALQRPGDNYITLKLSMRGMLTPVRCKALIGCYAAVPVEKRNVMNENSERCDKEVGAPEDRIEWLKPYPDAPAQNLEHRYLDQSSPLTREL